MRRQVISVCYVIAWYPEITACGRYCASATSPEIVNRTCDVLNQQGSEVADNFLVDSGVHPGHVNRAQKILPTLGAIRFESPVDIGHCNDLAGQLDTAGAGLKRGIPALLRLAILEEEAITDNKNQHTGVSHAGVGRAKLCRLCSERHQRPDQACSEQGFQFHSEHLIRGWGNQRVGAVSSVGEVKIFAAIL